MGDDYAILTYTQHTLADPGLRNGVRYTPGRDGAPAQLQAQRRNTAPGPCPTALVCDDARVHRLVDAGYLVLRGTRLTITLAGEAALARG